MTDRALPFAAEPRDAYILPLCWADDSALAELVVYLEQLCSWITVTVVDGSPDELFINRHADRFPTAVNHIRPDPGRTGNGKVCAVTSAVRISTAERLVIADDDVRYTHEVLAAVIAGLDDADVVRPQNYFSTWPWHARWDTARTLINRTLTGDFPGTLAVRRAALDATGEYDPVLFENLELIRTVMAAGGREQGAPEVFVARIPPTARHFLQQRIRHAYDDFAQPGRLAAELALLPLPAGAGGSGPHAEQRPGSVPGCDSPVRPALGPRACHMPLDRPRTPVRRRSAIRGHAHQNRGAFRRFLAAPA